MVLCSQKSVSNSYLNRWIVGASTNPGQENDVLWCVLYKSYYLMRMRLYIQALRCHGRVVVFFIMRYFLSFANMYCVSITILIPSSIYVTSRYYYSHHNNKTVRRLMFAKRKEKLDVISRNKRKSHSYLYSINTITSTMPTMRFNRTLWWWSERMAQTKKNWMNWNIFLLR